MKDRRLYAIILLAALALLQVRVAFAACDVAPQKALHSIGAAPCGEHQGTENAMPSVDDIAVSCALSDCVAMVAPQESDYSTLLGSGFSALAHAPPPAACSAYSSDASLHASVTPAHGVHTRLIYVLQRLLI